MRFQTDNDEVLNRNRRHVVRCFDTAGNLGRAVIHLQLEAAFLDCFQMRTAGNQRDVFAGVVQPHSHQSADRPGANYANLHGSVPHADV